MSVKATFIVFGFDAMYIACLIVLHNLQFVECNNFRVLTD